MTTSYKVNDLVIFKPQGQAEPCLGSVARAIGTEYRVRKYLKREDCWSQPMVVQWHEVLALVTEEDMKNAA